MDAVAEAFEAYRKAPVDPALRAGDHALALCRFDEAVDRYDEALRHPSGRFPDAEGRGRAEKLLALAREARAEHDVQVGLIDARLAENDIAGGLLALGVARRRFSRSVPLKERRDRVESAICDRFASPRRTVEGDLRKAAFAEARAYLDQVASLLGVPGARRLLRKFAGDEAVLDGTTVARLRASVDEREALHTKLQAAIEEAVGAMDFPRARDAMEEYQNQFPCPGTWSG